MSAVVHHESPLVTLLHGDASEALAMLPDDSVDCVVTSPPYFGARDYGEPLQIGLEPSPDEYAAALAKVFSGVGRVLRPDGALWLNLADVYGGGGIARPTGKWPSSHDPSDRMNGRRRSFDKEKCLLGVPDLVASALVDEGWVLRNRVIWVKARPIPSNGKDRLDSRYEFIYLLVRRDGRRPRYRFDKSAHDDRGDVWMIPTERASVGHYAQFPVALPERCLSYTWTPGAVVLDPFSGSGTTGVAALARGGKYIGIDTSAEYLDESLVRMGVA